MKIQRIDLDDDEFPSTVTVTMTRDEARYLALLVGELNGIQAEEVMTGGGQLNANVYECLTGRLFNRFYEDGVSGAVSER